LAIEQERQGNNCADYPLWLSNVTSVYKTSAKLKSASSETTAGQQTAADSPQTFPVDPKLEMLAREVYYLMRQRIEIERERWGRY
jgi:hypothetical protein